MVLSEYGPGWRRRHARRSRAAGAYAMRVDVCLWAPAVIDPGHDRTSRTIGHGGAHELTIRCGTHLNAICRPLNCTSTIDTLRIHVKGPEPRIGKAHHCTCLLYTSPSPRDRQKSRMPSSA